MCAESVLRDHPCMIAVLKTGDLLNREKKYYILTVLLLLTFLEIFHEICRNLLGKPSKKKRRNLGIVPKFV